MLSLNKVIVVIWICFSNGNVIFVLVWYKNGFLKNIGIDVVVIDMSEFIIINFLKLIGKFFNILFILKVRNIKINVELKIKLLIKLLFGLLWLVKNI